MTKSATAWAFAFTCLATTIATAQTGDTRDVGRPVGERPPFESVAKALGMERGVRRELTSINTIFFTAKGTIGDRKVSSALYSMSYFIPALRTDTSWRAKGKTEREIEVANGALAWNESEPGVGAIPTSEAAAVRLRQLWLTPQGAVRAMVDARARNRESVKITDNAGRTVLSMEFQGGPLEVSTDENHLPERVRWTVDGHQTEAQFYKYKDWELLDVFFPQRIVQRVDGQVVLDLTVTDFRSNPYVIFPIPAELRHK